MLVYAGACMCGGGGGGGVRARLEYSLDKILRFTNTFILFYYDY